MLGNALGVLVALFGLFAVGAFGSAIVWTMFAWIGRRHDWLLSFVTPLGLASAAAPLDPQRCRARWAIGGLNNGKAVRRSSEDYRRLWFSHL